MGHGANAARAIAAIEAKFPELTPDQKARVAAVRATIKPEESAVGPPAPGPG